MHIKLSTLKVIERGKIESVLPHINFHSVLYFPFAFFGDLSANLVVLIDGQVVNEDSSRLFNGIIFSKIIILLTSVLLLAVVVVVVVVVVVASTALPPAALPVWSTDDGM
jgi:hypothetical protein